MNFVFKLLGVVGFLLALSGCIGSDGADGESLDGTRWRLSSGVESPPDAVPTLVFERERAGGRDGCNDFSVDYEVDGESMTLGSDVLSTDASCAGTPQGATEEAYLSLFFDVDGWRIDDGEFVLSSDGEDVLRYAPRNPKARELVERQGSQQSE